MNKKEIVKILLNNEFGELNKNNQYTRGVKSEHFEMIAEEIVKLFLTPDIRVKEVVGWSGDQTSGVDNFCKEHKIISVTPVIREGRNDRYVVVYCV